MRGPRRLEPTETETGPRWKFGRLRVLLGGLCRRPHTHPAAAAAAAAAEAVDIIDAIVVIIITMIVFGRPSLPLRTNDGNVLCDAAMNHVMYHVTQLCTM